MQTAYVFSVRKLGVGSFLKLLGLKQVIYISPFDKKTVAKKILKADASDFLLIVHDDEDGIGLLEEFRFRHSILSPFLVLSFSARHKVEKKFTASPKTKKPILKFDKSIKYLQLPVRIDNLREGLQLASAVSASELEPLIKEYSFATRYKEDSIFRHQFANLASAIRILQGSYYAGHLNRGKYLFAIDSLRKRVWRVSEHRAYARAFKEYVGKMRSINESFSIKKPKSLRAPSGRLMLLDDEAETAGWDVVLKTIFDKQCFSLEIETDREKFLSDIETRESLNFDVVLLDLKMPDLPERSIYLVERMAERYPDIPVIIFSGLIDLPYFRKCQEAGAFNYFAKELGSEDRDPENYYNKFVDVIADAVKFREELIRKNKKRNVLGSEEEPYFDVTYCDNSKVWHSSFVYRVGSIRGLSSESIKHEIVRLADVRSRLLSWLYTQPADGRCLSLRLVGFPEEKRLEILFVGITSANDSIKAAEKSASFAKDLWSWLKMLSPTYRVVPVTREAEFINLVGQKKLKNSYVAHRRRYVLKPNRTGFFEWFHPLTLNPESNLLATIEMMLAWNDVVSIDLSLMPFRARAEVLSLIKDCNRMKEDSPHLGEVNTFEVDKLENRENIVREILNPAEVGKIVEHISNELLLCRDGGFMYDFVVSSSEPIPDHLLENIRYDYFGNQSKIDFIENAPKVNKSTQSVLENGCSAFAQDEASVHKYKKFVSLSQALSLFKLPIPDDEGVDGVEEDKAKFVELPRQYSRPNNSKKTFVFAEGFRDNKIEQVYIQEKDLNKHLYICGKTGSGKSTLLLSLIMSLVEKGEGLCLIDPHEDLADMVLERIPENRVQDVIYFNPRAANHIVGINLLENDGSEEQQDLIVQEFTAMMFKMFSAESMGPLFERCMRYTLFLLMSNNLSILNFAKVWNDIDFREKCLKNINPESERGSDIAAFWQKEVPKWKGDTKSDLYTYVISKFDRMNTSKVMRSILGANKSTIDINKIMQKGNIFLVNLPKGLLGEVNANILGMIISTKVRLATLSRASEHKKDRTPFYLVIDEFQNFVASGGISYSKGGYDETFTTMLSEARKYNVSLILANQYLEQLGEGIRRALFGNIGSLIAFKAGVEDAKYLQEHFANKLSADDFRTVPLYCAYANLLLNGESLPPFTVRTMPIEDMPPDFKRKAMIVKRSTERYGIN